ncbi:hypothetical protein [Mycolicibacterium holsaticum]|uniref:Uncharacterized protein n=1 Tax=Mycolicibacterium holsaticum TaxID=152142 RepID=A0A1E3RZM3_9MYCO|nr:hypothetical protein [Mycolicibacterium holsaticum]MDA4107836.1 hypothetical protein [Mycolicibacterium holsaticum DSM 44478 = JCM 12374]ODQ95383.1 hypothetical protein BHQ17_05165 [Mycolicibacterium holsaticum]QZA14721.1 hypothetical protein K3U96_11840 [Mycolicibacterium holsaticum DSM 44478 = JCM 12374]UNC07836.1 hypothetical protein H5U41_14995 [Mycolicibacterium holsaticum DSM 44478 = JCM 12374]
MRARSLTISAADVESRIRQRLIGVGNTARHVVWQTGDHAVLLRSDRVRARLLEGWLMVSIELQTDQTGRRQLELVYRLGAPESGRGTGAAVKINAATPQALALAEVWGADLQRVVWDAVLDAVEAAVSAVRRREPRQPLVLRGFHAGREGFTVEVASGSR